ncbi:alpha-tocopherol transfer protein isoform X2 [Anabrus simplex]|uniref:alpha-tocopherol transfer protein isoform X2 n=1 Tax=Anabrus simplex TaxID=316456 RepID=UPI0035A37B51
MPQTEVILSTHDVTTSADKRRNQNVTMTLELPTEEQLARIYDELAMNPDTIERDVAYLKEWISKQPHLPNGIDDRFLRNSLIFRKNSLEKVKESVDLFYSVKSLAPELLSNRDPFDPALQGEMENLFFYPLPKLTQDGSRVIISKLFCTDPKMFYYPSAAKLVLMVAAVSLLEDRCLSHTIVFDLQGITMSHLATVQIPLARKFIYIGQIHIHSGGLDSLFDALPRSIFPVDYGGEEISLRDIQKKWRTKLVEYRSWFLEDDKKTVDERKRPGKPRTHYDMFGFEGSFRQLSVD